MKSSFVLISIVAVATAGFAVSSNAIASPPDAQVQAAALLSPSVSKGTGDNETASSQSVALDAQAHAAALLSGVRVDREADAAALVTRSKASSDAQAQAAALLSGLRGPSVEVARTGAI
jgi:hypothetical protein